MNRFTQDLKTGQIAENAVGFALFRINEYLYIDGQTNESKELNKLREYDLELSTVYDQRLTFEIKNNIKSIGKDTIAVETACNGRFSGINTSKADYYVMISGNECYIIERLKLLEYMTVNQPRLYSSYGGDNYSVLVFVPKADIINMGAYYFELLEEDWSRARDYFNFDFKAFAEAFNRQVEKFQTLTQKLYSFFDSLEEKAALPAPLPPPVITAA